MPTDYIFKCNCCDTIYNEIPLCFGADYPDYYFSLPETEREGSVEVTESLCVIDGHFFHRGRLIIPITDYSEDLIFNVWTTISEDNFRLRNDLWNDPERMLQKPYFGWLDTPIPTYEKSLSIKTIAHENEVGLIPTIEIIDESHDLFYDQQNGISLEEAVNKVQQILASTHQNKQ